LYLISKQYKETT